MISFDLPPNAGSERDQAILDHVRNGNYEVTWATITSDHAGHHAEFQIFADALKIGGVRVNVTAKLQQQIADELGCMLLTPKLADLMWAQREVTLPPHLVRPFSVTTAAMVQHSQMIDAALAKMSNPYGLLGTVGKHWVIDNGLLPKRMLQGAPVAMNYGWHFVGQSFGGSGFEITATHMQDDLGRLCRLVQGKGTKHNILHVDYSQTCTLVWATCTVDGNEMPLSDLLQHPVLSHLANQGGFLSVLRQPGV